MKEKKKIYAVIDTNVLVSALFSKTGLSHPAQVITAVIQGIITPLYNHEIINEYRDVLSRDKFKFKTEAVESLLSVFTLFGIDSVRVKAYNEIFPDSDDIVFYEVTMSKEDAYLVTGNLKHFPQKSFVVTPAKMIEILQEKELLE